MFLVGDAGELRRGRHPVCDWLKQHVDWNDTSNVLVYLGDNVYPQGMRRGEVRIRDSARKILDYQVSVVAGKNGGLISFPATMTGGRGKPAAGNR